MEHIAENLENAGDLWKRLLNSPEEQCTAKYTYNAGSSRPYRCVFCDRCYKYRNCLDKVRIFSISFFFYFLRIYLCRSSNNKNLFLYLNFSISKSSTSICSFSAGNKHLLTSKNHRKNRKITLKILLSVSL